CFFLNLLLTLPSPPFQSSRSLPSRLWLTSATVTLLCRSLHSLQLRNFSPPPTDSTPNSSQIRSFASFSSLSHLCEANYYVLFEDLGLLNSIFNPREFLIT